MGKALAQSVIENGDFVIGTFRNRIQAEEYNNEHKEEAFALTLDITKPNEIDKAFNLVRDKFRKVDVLVNNAGFGLAGAIEEISIAETREIFETNFFGTLGLTQAFLPFLGNKKADTLFKFHPTVVLKHFQALVFTMQANSQ